MSRSTGAVLVTFLVGAIVASTGCKQLAGRSANREGNRQFREMQFVDAVGSYEKALKTVEDPIIHYNLGLAYTKVFKPGFDGPILLGIEGDAVCGQIPGVKMVPAQVCVKAGDRTFVACDAKNVCPSSFQCKQAQYCSLTAPEIANTAATQFQAWLAANTKDDDTRKQMTQVWIDSEQYPKALEYWQKQLDAKPNDPAIMGNLAGINLKAGEWRKSIAWYSKVAEVVPDESAKVSAYQFIGNVAWAKLSSRTLDATESMEVADKGIGALQKAALIAPKNARLFGLQGSIYNFRSFIQGASFAAAIERANAQDLQKVSRVLAEQAKAAVGGTTPPVTSTHPAPGSAAGSGSASGSAAGSAAGSGSGSATAGSGQGR